MNHPTFLIAAALLAVAACTPTDQSTLLGAAGGAAVGAAIADEDETEGALIGAAVGAIAGNLIGRSQDPGQCIYEDRYGRRYTDRCP